MYRCYSIGYSEICYDSKSANTPKCAGTLDRAPGIRMHGLAGMPAAVVSTGVVVVASLAAQLLRQICP